MFRTKLMVFHNTLIIVNNEYPNKPTYIIIYWLIPKVVSPVLCYFLYFGQAIVTRVLMLNF